MSQTPPARIDAHFVAAGKYHDIDHARLEVLKLLAEHPQIRTTVACNYGDTERLNACQFLVTYTCDLMPSPEEAAAIRAWLEKGGKWLALHGTNSILVFTECGRVDAPPVRGDV
ncbi:MAG: ThuA domain-containing protein, partial [Novosphingobium sp.]